MASVRYNFARSFALLIHANKQNILNHLEQIDNSEDLLDRVMQIKNQLIVRFDNSRAAPPEINGKSLNPIVLGLVSYKNQFSNPIQLDSILKASKEFSSFETASGRIVEDIFPINFGYETVTTNSHDPFSEIDCKKISNNVANLIALKSGPACINDTMSNKIGSAIAEHNSAWFDFYQVRNIIFTIGMNYSTPTLSNKKDWHAIRLAQLNLETSGFTISQRCLDEDNVAYPSFTAHRGGNTIVVQTLHGKKLWDYVCEDEISFTVLILALTLASVQTPAPLEEVEVFTRNLWNTVNIQGLEHLRFNNFSNLHLPWFFLFYRHFIDDFVVN